MPGLTDAMENSLKIAALSTIVATILGTLMALALVRYQFRGRAATNLFIFLPLATPEVVLGASLLSLFLTLGFATGFTTILIAHIMFNISFVVVTVRSRLIGFDRHLEEAAQDLGANGFQTFMRVTLPLIAPGGAGGGAARVRAVDRRLRDHQLQLRARPSRSRCSSGARRASPIPPQINIIATMIFLVDADADDLHGLAAAPRRADGLRPTRKRRDRPRHGSRAALVQRAWLALPAPVQRRSPGRPTVIDGQRARPGGPAAAPAARAGQRLRPQRDARRGTRRLVPARRTCSAGGSSPSPGSSRSRCPGRPGRSGSPLRARRSRRASPAAARLPARRRLGRLRPRHARQRVPLPRQRGRRPRAVGRLPAGARASVSRPRSTTRSPRSATPPRTPPSSAPTPDAIAVGGDSAGGNLAAVVCTAGAPTGGVPRRRSCCCIYPVTDLSEKRDVVPALRRGLPAHQARHGLVPRALPRPTRPPRSTRARRRCSPRTCPACRRRTSRRPASTRSATRARNTRSACATPGVPGHAAAPPRADPRLRERRRLDALRPRGDARGGRRAAGGVAGPARLSRLDEHLREARRPAARDRVVRARAARARRLERLHAAVDRDPAAAAAAHEGVGEDVTYDALDHVALQDAGPVLPLAGLWTLGELLRARRRARPVPGRARARRLAALPPLGVRERGARPRAAAGRHARSPTRSGASRGR